MYGPLKGAASTSIVVSHLVEADPAQPGTTIRSGYPCTFGSGAPFMSNATMVWRSIAFDIGMLRVTGGMVGNAPKSEPVNATCAALDCTPAALSTSVRLTPVQRGQPIPPVGGQGVPRGVGLKPVRPEPAHSSIDCVVKTGRRLRSES